MGDLGRAWVNVSLPPLCAASTVSFPVEPLGHFGKGNLECPLLLGVPCPVVKEAVFGVWKDGCGNVKLDVKGVGSVDPRLCGRVCRLQGVPGQRDQGRHCEAPLQKVREGVRSVHPHKGSTDARLKKKRKCSRK